MAAKNAAQTKARGYSTAPRAGIGVRLGSGWRAPAANNVAAISSRITGSRAASCGLPHHDATTAR